MPATRQKQQEPSSVRFKVGEDRLEKNHQGLGEKLVRILGLLRCNSANTSSQNPRRPFASAALQGLNG
jgi:hypothetical protein